MIENILLCVFATVMYWGICQFFTAYSRRCLSRAFYVTVRNTHLWLLLGGRYRGRRKLPEEGWHKCSILGLASYIALLPVLLALYAAIFDLYMFDTHSGIALTAYGFAIVLLNVFDDLLGSMFYR